MVKVDDILASRGPNLQPAASDARDLAFLRPALQRAGYDDKGVLQLLDAYPLYMYGRQGYLWRARNAKTPCGDLARLFMLRDMLERPTLEAILGADGVNTLLARGMLSERAGHIVANVDLYPCLGAWVFTDHTALAVDDRRKVYEIGADSYTLALMTPRRAVGSTLDLCTGSGIHAILAAAHTSGPALGVDVNDRAINFSQINAALNGVGDRCSYRLSDLYEGLEPAASFDLIVANPPWVATPDETMELYRWGGEDGEVLTRRVVQGLPTRLRPHGTLAMYVIYPQMRDSKYLDRLQSWLPDNGAGWGIGLVDLYPIPLEPFIHTNTQGTRAGEAEAAEFARYMETYQRNGIERMWTAMAYVRRLREGAPGWTAYKQIPLPSRSLGHDIDAWLDAHETWSDPHWRPSPEFTARLHPNVKHLYVDVQRDTGVVEFNDADWMGWVELDVSEAALARQIAQGKAGDGDALRSLGRKQVLAPN